MKKIKIPKTAREIGKRVVQTKIMYPIINIVDPDILVAPDWEVAANMMEYVRFLNQHHRIAPVSLQLKPIKEFLNDVEKGKHKDLEVKGTHLVQMLEEKLKESQNYLILYPDDYTRISAN